MVGKNAQCAFLLMVNWLGQCPSAVLQAGVSQHPAPQDLDSHHSSLIRGGGGSRVPGNMGSVGLAKELWPSLPTKAGRWGLFFHPLLHSFGMEDGLGLFLHDGLAHPKCAMGAHHWSSPLKKGSWSCTAHRLCFTHCKVPLGFFQMWHIPPINVFIWQAPGSVFECYSSLWVWDGWPVQNDFL